MARKRLPKLATFPRPWFLRVMGSDAGGAVMFTQTATRPKDAEISTVQCRSRAMTNAPTKPANFWSLKSAVEQIEKCGFTQECEGGALAMNDAFIWLKAAAKVGPEFLPGQGVYFEVEAEASGVKLRQWMFFYVVGCAMDSGTDDRFWTYSLSYDPPAPYYYGTVHFRGVRADKLRLTNPAPTAPPPESTAPAPSPTPTSSQAEAQAPDVTREQIARVIAKDHGCDLGYSQEFVRCIREIPNCECAKRADAILALFAKGDTP